MSGYIVNRNLEVLVEVLRPLFHAVSGFQAENSALYAYEGSRDDIRTFDGTKWVEMEEASEDGILFSLQHKLSSDEMESFFREAIKSLSGSFKFMVHVSTWDMKVGTWSGVGLHFDPTLSEGFKNEDDLHILLGDEDGMPSRIRDLVLSLLVMKS